jgi:hypothetical protein
MAPSSPLVVKMVGVERRQLSWQRGGCSAQALADRCNSPTADLHSQQLIQQRLGLAETQREGITQQTHQGTEPGPVAAGLHIHRQRGAGAGGTARADQPVPPMLDHQRRDRWDLNHLMPQWLWFISLEQGAAATARLKVMLNDIVNTLDRH